MTTPATKQGTERTIAERDAWTTYRESLRDLEGMNYEETERVSWQRLQWALRDLEVDPEGH